VAWTDAYLRTKWHLNPSSRLATTDMGQKLGAAVPRTLGTAELGPHLPQRGQGRARTSMPNFILIHPTVWPQYINVTDRQTDIAGKRSHSIERIVSQTVVQNCVKYARPIAKIMLLLQVTLVLYGKLYPKYIGEIMCRSGNYLIYGV